MNSTNMESSCFSGNHPAQESTESFPEPSNTNLSIPKPNPSSSAMSAHIDQPDYRVQSIVFVCGNKFLVKWLGYKYPTWEPLEMVSKSKGAVAYVKQVQMIFQYWLNDLEQGDKKTRFLHELKQITRVYEREELSKLFVTHGIKSSASWLQAVNEILLDPAKADSLLTHDHRLYFYFLLRYLVKSLQEVAGLTPHLVKDFEVSLNVVQNLDNYMTL